MPFFFEFPDFKLNFEFRYSKMVWVFYFMFGVDEESILTMDLLDFYSGKTRPDILPTRELLYGTRSLRI